MPTTRQIRVNELLREEIMRLLMREMRDPRLGMVSITEVSVSPDLRQAQVYFSTLGDQQARQQTLEALTGAAGFIHRELVKALRMKHVPQLAFRIDDSIERGVRISNLLRQVESEPRPEIPQDSPDR